MGLLRTAVLASAAAAGYRALVRGDLTIDTGIGRRTRPLVCAQPTSGGSVPGGPGAWGRTVGSSGVRESFAAVKTEAERRAERR